MVKRFSTNVSLGFQTFHVLNRLKRIIGPLGPSSSEGRDESRFKGSQVARAVDDVPTKFLEQRGVSLRCMSSHVIVKEDEAFDEIS